MRPIPNHLYLILVIDFDFSSFAIFYMWTILRGSELKPIEELHLLKLRFKYNHPTLLTQLK